MAGIDRAKIDVSVRFDDQPPVSGIGRLFRDYYGPTMNAFAAAGASGRKAELEAELVALFEAQNTRNDKARTTIPATFLRVTVQV